MITPTVADSPRVYSPGAKWGGSHVFVIRVRTPWSTRVAGFEPATSGSVDLDAVGASVVGAGSCENRQTDLCAGLRAQWPIDDDGLVEVVEAWASLPPAIRAGVLATVRAVR